MQASVDFHNAEVWCFPIVREQVPFDSAAAVTSLRMTPVI
jgi:hypothetical protein